MGCSAVLLYLILLNRSHEGLDGFSRNIESSAAVRIRKLRQELLDACARYQANPEQDNQEVTPRAHYVKIQMDLAFSRLRIAIYRRYHPARLRRLVTKSILLLVIVSLLSAPFAGTVSAAPAIQNYGSNLPSNSNLSIGPITKVPRPDSESGGTDLQPASKRESWELQKTTGYASATGFAMGTKAALQQSLLPKGSIIYEGLLVDMFSPIAAIPGHRYALHIAFERIGCGNCAASTFIGDEPDVWPFNILAQCGTAFGETGQCVTAPFISPGNALFIDILLTPSVPFDAGIARVVDLDLPPGVLPQSALSTCQPKEDQGDARECQVNGTKDTQGYAGDPINTRTGAFDILVPDLSMITAAGPLIFQRTYSSAATELHTSNLGPGWTHNHDTRLIFPDDPGGEENSIWRKAHTANLYRFIIVGNGTFEAYPGVLATLVRNSGPPRSYTLTNRAQETYTFDEDGVLLS